MSKDSQLIDLGTAKHQGWRPATEFGFARQLPAIAAQLAELGPLTPNVPLAFARMGNDQYALVAVTGFADGRNQLVDDQGRWVLQYLPLELQSYPFTLQPLKQEEGSPVTLGVAFNHASGLYRESPDPTAGEQRFFNDEGKPQPGFALITQMLQRRVTQQRMTQRAVKALQDAELLIPWQIQPREGQPDEVLPKGLYRVDEAKLNTLKGEALQTLHEAHALALAYGQLLSMSRLTVLQRLKDAHTARRQASATTQPDPAVVEQVFGGGQGDTMKFNF